MSRLLDRSSRRYLAQHPWQVALSVLGIALGVGVVVAIELANQSAERAFRLSTEKISGRATHQLVAGPAGVPEELYAWLKVELGIERAAPVIEELATLDGEGPDASPRTLRLLGVDPFAERVLRPALSAGLDAGALVGRSRLARIAESTADELGIGAGERLELRVGGRRASLSVDDLLRGDQRGIADLVVVDLATAQELSGAFGRLTRIDLVLEPSTVGALAAALPPGVELVAVEGQRRAAAAMIDSFQLNLRALALLALLCGGFLVYNTVAFSVLQRRQLIGRLRALGVTRRQVLRSILAETLALALAGCALGLLLGVAMGHVLVRLVTRTINDLYFVLSVRGLALEPLALATGVGLGVAISLLAALPAAREATHAPPRASLSRSELEERTRRRLPRLAAGAALLLAAGALLLAAEGPLLVAFAGMFAVVMGCALLAPPATALLMRGLQGALGRRLGLLGRMAARGVVASLSRTGVAIAALTVAVSVTVGVGVMIDSFRVSVSRWLEHTLAADIYVSPLRPARGGSAPLPPELAAELARLPEIERVNTLRRVEIVSDAGPVQLAAADLDARGRGSFHLVEGVPEAAWRALAERDAVLVSEPFAFRRSLAVGDELELRTDSGERAFEVAGVYRDYGSDQGSVLLVRELYDRWWSDRGFTALALFVRPGVDVEAAIERVRAASAGVREVSARSNRAIRELSLEIFDRTFLITGVLRLLTGAVAFLGILGALTALQLERARELAVLRANGLTPRQVWRLVTAQTGLMGLAAGLLSIPMGSVMALIMTHVINRRSFGWSVELLLPPGVFVEALALAVGAALLAGIYPAYRMATTSPALALRQE